MDGDLGVGITTNLVTVIAHATYKWNFIVVSKYSVTNNVFGLGSVTLKILS
jgi:hypothetical protein